MDKLDPSYLRRYHDRYRTHRGEDGVWCIGTRIHPRDGLIFDICVFGEGVLAATVPPRMASKLLKDFPVFRVHQNAEDAVVLLFPEEELENLAERLKLKRKRRVSEAERSRLREMGRRYRIAPADR